MPDDQSLNPTSQIDAKRDVDEPVPLQDGLPPEIASPLTTRKSPAATDMLEANAVPDARRHIEQWQNSIGASSPATS